jgi:heme-degrading monooxygenase HmoA
MFAVIFEVNPRPDQWDTYLSYARSLRPELEQIEGFIDNERFSSLRRECCHCRYGATRRR